MTVASDTTLRCPLCQDYMFSVTDNVDPKMLKDADVNLVVIGNGSYNMIKSYKRMCFIRCVGPVTDD